MGHQVICSGYLELVPERRTENAAEFSRFDFDRTYPFTNCFSPIRDGYRADMVSFAGAYKHDDEDFYDPWVEKFEALLRRLHGYSARLTMEHEDRAEGRRYVYVAGDAGWKRWSEDSPSQGDLVIIKHASGKM